MVLKNGDLLCNRTNNWRFRGHVNRFKIHITFFFKSNPELRELKINGAKDHEQIGIRIKSFTVKGNPGDSRIANLGTEVFTVNQQTFTHD